MGYFELFQESPALFFLVLIISLILTLLVYGAFPIIFANVRKTPITKKKYKWICFGVNIIGILLFIVLNGEVSAGPYILWTWIFSNTGVKTLEKKGLLIDAPKNTEEIREGIGDDVCFCRKCGAYLEDDNKFCGKCGTEIKEEKQ